MENCFWIKETGVFIFGIVVKLWIFGILLGLYTPSTIRNDMEGMMENIEKNCKMQILEAWSTKIRVKNSKFYIFFEKRK
jgi:hypothetical protein